MEAFTVKDNTPIKTVNRHLKELNEQIDMLQKENGELKDYCSRGDKELKDIKAQLYDCQTHKMKVNYHLDFERRKTYHLMRSIADLQRGLCRPHGVIRNDIENVPDPRRTVGQIRNGEMVVICTTSFVLGNLIGWFITHMLCK